MGTFQRRFANVRLLLCALPFAALAACGDRVDEATSQAVAQVNDRELTVHELDYELARLGMSDEPTSPAGREVAVSLVERALLAQHAIKMEFDRDPTVVYALRSARDQVLADAYLNRTVNNVTPPSEEQRRDYYAAHPELFAQRRGYHFMEMIAGEPITADEVRSAVAQHGTMDGLVGWLKEKNAVFATREVYAPAELISPAVLAELRELQQSKMALVEATDGVHAVQLIDAVDLPLSYEAVQEQIGELLFAQAQQGAVDSEIERVKASARVAWKGAFSSESHAGDEGADKTATKSKHIERGLEGL